MIEQTQKMDPDVKAKWLGALRGGEFPQIKGQLHTTGGYCCLGVLCELHSRAVMTAKWGPWNGGGRAYLGESSGLPSPVEAWADTPAGAWRLLAEMNDRGVSFSEIADYIEANY